MSPLRGSWNSDSCLLDAKVLVFSNVPLCLHGMFFLKPFEVEKGAIQFEMKVTINLNIV